MEGATTNVAQANSVPSETVPSVAAERRVLIIERSESSAMLQLKLSQAGFKVSTLGHDEDARLAVDRHCPDLVMIDWDLPAVIAMDLVRHIRRESISRGPRLIALSSFSEEQHVVSGFELGVDDYVVKPFSVPEVVARVRAVLRARRSNPDEITCIAFRNMQMDVNEGRLSISEKPISLRNMEFQLLQFLMRRPEHAYSREMLLRHVWGTNSRTGERAVDVTVQRIRRALAPHGCGDYLQTIRGLGYRLSAKVSTP